MPTLPFKLDQDRRHHIPKQKHKVTNWAAYDASLRQRGSLAVWFTDEAIGAWRAEARPTRGGQRRYSALAILTALTLRAVFRLALRQTEGLIGSVVHLLGPALAVPDHSTLSRRAETLEAPRLRPGGNGEPVHLLVDSTGLKLCGAGEWLAEKHGTRTRRALRPRAAGCFADGSPKRRWSKLHIGLDADTGQIVAATLTGHDVDDGSQPAPCSIRWRDPWSRSRGTAPTIGRTCSPVSPSVIPARPSSCRRDPAPCRARRPRPSRHSRDRHLQFIAEHGRMAWQTASGCTTRARAEAAIGRFKRVIGDGVRSRTSRTGQRRATVVQVAVHAFNRMLELGRPISLRIARSLTGLGPLRPSNRSMQHGS